MESEEGENDFDQVCTACLPRFQQLVATNKTHIRKLTDDFAKGLADKLKNLRDKFEINHKGEVQKMRIRYEATIAELKRKQVDLEAEILSFRHQLEEMNENDSEAPRSEFNAGTPAEPSEEVVLRMEFDDPSATLIKSEAELQIKAEMPDDCYYELLPAISGDCVNDVTAAVTATTLQTFECIVCKQIFGSLTEMHEHFALFSKQHYLEDPNWLNNMSENNPKNFEAFHCHESDCAWYSQSVAEFEEHLRQHCKQPFVCVTCKNEFEPYDLEAISHERNCRIDRRFKCQEPGCRSTYLEKNALNAHIRRLHAVQERYKCDCGKSFETPRGLDLHRKSHSADAVNKFVCQEQGCTRAFASYNRLICHLKAFHLILAPHKCLVPSCEKSFTLLNDLQKHSKDHITNTLVKNFKCHVGGCARAYLTKHSLNTHIQTFHLHKRPHKCEEPGCEITFPYLSDLLRHRLRKHPSEALKDELDSIKVRNGKYKCTALNCQRGFATERALKTHGIKCHQEGPPYRCCESNCEKSFASRVTCVSHVRNHTRGTDLLCNECGKAFNNESDFRIHLRGHSGERPFVCTNADCDKAFLSSKDLKNHMIIHSNIKQFACNFDGCTARYRTNHLLQVHLNKHKGLRPFACIYPDCKLSFTDSSALHRHKKVVHLNLRPFVCQFESCRKEYPCPSKLRQHMKKWHEEQ